MGAWGYKGYDNDSAMDWLDGLTDLLRFTLDHAFWSRWQEEGIAAAQLLTELPPMLQSRLGVYVFNEALEAVNHEHKEMSKQGWKRPGARKSYLIRLERKLEIKQKVLAKEEKRHKAHMKKVTVVVKKKAK